MTNSEDLTALYLDYPYLDEGLDKHRLPITEKLVGRSVELFEDEEDSAVFINFKNRSHLEWGKIDEPSVTEQYEAVEVRPNVFFVDWVCCRNGRQSVSLVMDFVSREAVLLHCQLPDQHQAVPCMHERIKSDNDLSAVKVRITHAGIGGKRTGKMHHRTGELVGKRLLHDYGGHIYEHIYLNKKLFTWHCLAGGGKGTADTEPCEYLKIGKELYLFIWREKISPWVGIVVIDISKMRTAGKVFYCNFVNTKNVFNYTVGAYVKFLNETKYE